MYKRLFAYSTAILTIWFLLSSCSTTKVITKKSDDKVHKEEISVLKDNESVKEGKYIKYVYGKKDVEGYYKNNVKSGKWTYYINGDVSFNGNYKNGEKHGSWHYLAPPNSVESFMNYKNGEKDSVWKSYYPNGNLMMETSYNKTSPSRELKFYYENGNIQNVRNFTNEGLNGASETYFPNGQLHIVEVYNSGKISSIKEAYDLNGKPIDAGNIENGTGVYKSYYLTNNNGENTGAILKSKKNYKDGELDGESIYYYRDGSIDEKGFYKDGEKVGEWIYYNSENGSVQTINHSDTDKKDARPDDDGHDADPLFTIVEQMPMFPGGEQGLLKFLASIQYPKRALEKDIQGTCYLKFVVNKLGEVQDIEVVRGAHNILNEASVNHVESMPRWNPGMQRGIPVKVQYVVPLKFRLN